MRIRLAVCAGAAALSIGAGTAAAVPAPNGLRPEHTGEAGAAATPGLDPARLQSALDELHRAGMPGVFAEVRDAGRTWRGASGVADLATGRPIRPDMRQRVGSVTKTFTAVAVMHLVEQGRLRLDEPIGDHLPQLVPGERGRAVTVRMLLDHTSGLADYLYAAFPSLADGSAASLEDNRYRQFDPDELIAMGVAAPPVGEPGGATGVYSNTNYLLLGRLIEQVTGTPAEEYITRTVVEPAGLRHTGFPTGPRIDGPHPRMYEALYGLLDPPRDFSVYDMSWVGPAAALVSTPEDLNRFFAALLAGRIVGPESLAQMQVTHPVRAFDGSTVEYGLGLHKVTVPGCGTFWGHDGSAWGAGTVSLTRADGARQMTVAINLMRWGRADTTGTPGTHPIDTALEAVHHLALCGRP
ncbi:serine hydrolase domain-containing protein [Kitasatospora terrestris]|uniref:Serine hydrolase domain-containing protein n=1 Tax=Kitasatospora terrestris TaxID=258051 RepID=A0ABP9D9N2_9ACTN